MSSPRSRGTCGRQTGDDLRNPRLRLQRQIQDELNAALSQAGGSADQSCPLCRRSTAVAMTPQNRHETCVLELGASAVAEERTATPCAWVGFVAMSIGMFIAI
jgi:hypothetical protein